MLGEGRSRRETALAAGVTLSLLDSAIVRDESLQAAARAGAERQTAERAQKRRAAIIDLVDAGLNIAEIAVRLDRQVSTIERWIADDRTLRAALRARHAKTTATGSRVERPPRRAPSGPKVDRVRALREACQSAAAEFLRQGLTRAQTARRVGVTPGTICKWIAERQDLRDAEIAGRALDSAGVPPPLGTSASGARRL
ncbi:hypothetical protein Bcep1808_2077 [Burkholderia vietnamiensis G4]|uniref:Homeodomain-like domain-containing protein n=1 Tax=Burkholderia vietnamiensis (strain G4 / LMG 22486) TaxID=269482 RepID=A4JFM6_BURVG|nr:hypothetical protein Bcep1808_2077 [Burkholderia vietnamiensis G4]